MSIGKFLRAESDCFVGKRGRLERYLICSTQGYFPVLVRTGKQALAAIFRTAARMFRQRHAGRRHLGGWRQVLDRPGRDHAALGRQPQSGLRRECQGDLIAAYWKACMDCYEDGRTVRSGKASTPRAGFRPWPCAAAPTTAARGAGNGPYKSELLALPSPFGRIIAGPDGSLLMGVYGTPRRKRKGVRDISILLRSRDGGRTWGDESLVATGHNEISYAFLPDGRLLAAARPSRVTWPPCSATIWAAPGASPFR